MTVTTVNEVGLLLSFASMFLFNPLDSKCNFSATSNNTKLVQAIDGWAVTFDTPRKGLGGLRPRPVPSSLYQM